MLDSPQLLVQSAALFTLFSMSSRDLESLLSALETANLPESARVDELRAQLTKELRLLAEYPAALPTLESEHHFAEQFETRSGILRSAGLTSDINGNAVTYPSYETVRERMLTRPELLRKFQQGFTRVQPVPFGAPLEAFLPPLEEALRKYHEEGKLRATDGTRLALNTEEPVWVWDAYNNADQNDSLMYGVKEFHSDPARHGGKTKTEILAGDPASAMQVHLTETLRNIPRTDKGLTVGDRPQLEAGLEPRQYLDLLGSGVYEQEAGYTPEAELAHLLCHLHETEGEMLDDFRSGSAAYCTGAWFPQRGNVPYVFFNRDFGQLNVDGVYPDYALPGGGVRSSVRVS